MAVVTTRRITANVPTELLNAALKLTGKGITGTIVEGLEQMRRRRFYDRALALKGKLHLNIDIDELRGRGSSPLK